MAVSDPVNAANAGPFVLAPGTAPWPGLHEVLRKDYLADEAEVVSALMPLAQPTPTLRAEIRQLAGNLVQAVRRTRGSYGGIDAFLQEYDLSSQEGILLMCIAEALLRIPDAQTADKLIAEKIGAGNWAEHLREESSAFVNASTWGLMFTGRLLGVDADVMRDPGGLMRRLAGRMGEPVVRQAMRQAMRIMGHEFVMGRTIGDALKRSRTRENAAYRYSFDMLGEAALTAEDAARYFDAYAAAIAAIAKARRSDEDEISSPSISVKLSALHPRYELAQRERVLAELTPRLQKLAELARDGGIGLCMDAEEAERLELSLELFERVASASALRGWNGFGLAVQAYQKRALALIGWLEGVGRANGRTIPVRLVKGAYWDTEVKRAQERGLAGYPVFTRKASTDLSYLACARQLLMHSPHLYPQFATHNAHTLASVYCLARSRADAKPDDYEFQRLHGMGEELYSEVIGKDQLDVRCRVYAPVGSHADLLPYLVRRLLENGANTSFVNRIVDEHAPVEEIIAEPADTLERAGSIAHPRIPLPRAMFPDRRNSPGINVHDPAELEQLRAEMQGALSGEWEAQPLVDGAPVTGARPVQSLDPTDERRVVGLVHMASESAADAALALAVRAQPAWDATPAEDRAAILERTADAFERHRGELLALCVREAGKTIPDAISEWREAIDFLRFYAAQARREFAAPELLPGPTGERNSLQLQGRGVFVCISPWNFPLAIFTGQVAAALAAGNAVIAKPAESTSLTAARVVQLLYEAGVPPQALAFLPGDGAVIGARLTADPRVDGVAFTGSTETAWAISRALAARNAPIASLIAETGGQNAMLVDSSALPEQVVLDVVQSAFNSAGQRCSALRVLYLQKDIAPHVLRLLEGYVQELSIGDPALLSTDIGPAIDRRAQQHLLAHIDGLAAGGKLLFRREPGTALAHGCFVGPAALQLDSIGELEREVFGPVLHVITYASQDLDQVVEQINSTGYGLTLGVHSRIDGVGEYIASRVRAGNVYVNRNMVGAVVGVQPFGGRGLSGTGPKAGGPHYLHRFAHERTVTVNTAAVGGNASLLSLNAD
jgi:RHH-type proline utilization regulon transcriptional repressor/proline dehydrogenase/delta 1-pyrroline-5-carboxylate dehydrogenase